MTTSNDPLDHACALHDRSMDAREEGRFTDALAPALEALALFEEHEGPEHPDVANVLNNLGTVLAELARYDEAETYLRRSVDIMEALGSGHGPAIEMIRGQSMRALGDLYRMMGRYRDAERLLRSSLELVEREMGDDVGELSSALNNLAIVYKYTGEFDRA